MNVSAIITRAEQAFNCYIGTSISCIGVILLIISLVIFLNKQFKENFYNYIRIEVIFSILTLLFYSLRANYYCPNPQTYGSYINSVIHIISTYFRNVFDLLAILFTILSSLECFITVKSPSKNNLISKISYKLITAVVVVLCTLFFIYRLFEYDIKPQTHRNRTLYFLQKSNFSKSSFYAFNKTTSFAFSNGITVFILVILNILLFLSIRKSIRNKIRIQSSIRTNAKRSNDDTLDRKNKLTRVKINHQVKLLVYGGSLNAIIARMPSLILLVIEFELSNTYSDFRSIVVLISLASLLISYSIKFVLFYFSNNLFRCLLNQYVIKLYYYAFKKH